MSDKTKKARPKQYSNKTRNPQSIVGKIAEYGDTAINTLIGGIGVAGGLAVNELRKLKKFQDKQRKLGQQAHMKKFLEKKNKRVKKTTPPGRGGGGGGGFGKFSTIQRGLGTGSKTKLPQKDFL